MLISPTEPPELRAIGETSSVPETYGADVLWPSTHGLVGVQRKEFKDLVNSVRDGRLGKELAQMKSLSVGVVIIEGDGRWTTDGQSLIVQSWSETQHLGLMLSIQLSGCWIITSPTLTKTVSSILQLKKWLDKDHHSLLMNRPNPTSQWGKADNRDWGIHLLQSFPGIGYKVAGQIYDHFGGVPIEWTVDELELIDVPGVGVGRARNLLKVLAHETRDKVQEIDGGYIDLRSVSETRNS